MYNYGSRQAVRLPTPTTCFSKVFFPASFIAPLFTLALTVTRFLSSASVIAFADITHHPTPTTASSSRMRTVASFRPQARGALSRRPMVATFTIVDLGEGIGGTLSRINTHYRHPANREYSAIASHVCESESGIVAPLAKICSRSAAASYAEKPEPVSMGPSDSRS